MKFLHATGLDTVVSVATGLSDDDYAHQYGWILEGHVDYDTYRQVNDVAVENGESIDSFVERAIKREVRRNRLRLFVRRLLCKSP